MNRHYTLYELNNLVKNIVEETFTMPLWVEAEVSEAREVRGHCYLELVQKDITGSTPVARASAKCWKNTWSAVRKRFETVTNQSLRSGMKLLLLVTANFHEAYGFSWIVEDIDPTFTLGDMLKKRMEIVSQLKAEGVYDLQKQLQLPMFAQRVAVISSENAAGYGDFCNQLLANDYGLRFSITLFPAIMQGERVEKSIIAALNKINDNLDAYDVVVIIRGGGATADLSGFDTLALAENVANFPLPIITGIGHDRDESVLDMIAHIKVKTPTAAAALLIDNLATTLNRVEQAANRITTLFLLTKTRQEARIQQIMQHMLSAISRKQMIERHRLSIIETRLHDNNPKTLLTKGYSITTSNGKIVRSTQQIKKGDKVRTILPDGEFDSVVSLIKK